MKRSKSFNLNILSTPMIPMLTIGSNTNLKGFLCVFQFEPINSKLCLCDKLAINAKQELVAIFIKNIMQF